MLYLQIDNLKKHVFLLPYTCILKSNKPFEYHGLYTN